MAIDVEKLKQAATASLNKPGHAHKMPKNAKKKGPRLYIFRHCETHDNIRRIFSGKRQTRLTQIGHEQAQAIALQLKDETIHLFISPPLHRCRQTLKYLKKYHTHIPHSEHPELVERDYGSLTGKSKTRIMREHPQEAVLWRRSWDIPPPQGESLKDVWEKRIKPFCIRLEERMQKENINIVWCGTNNTVRLVRMYFERLTIEETLILENPHGDYALY